MTTPVATAAVPASALGGFYFWYFAAIGTLLPYLGLFLQERGCSPAQIGAIGGILALTRIVAPYLWGLRADRSGRRMQAVLHALGFGLVSFAALQFAESFLLLALFCLLYGMFNNGTMPQFEVVTFQYLRNAADRYGRIRLWGSLGFIVAVLAMGPVFEWLGVASFPLWVAGMFALAWLTALRIAEPVGGHGDAAGVSVLSVLRQPAVMALLAACLLSQLSFGPYYNFFSIWLKAHGYSPSVIGFLWAFGVIAEIGLFLVLHRLRRFWSLRSMLLWALAGTAVRWGLQDRLVDHLAWLTAVQTLHAVSFALYHYAAISLIQRLFSGPQQGRGQALYTGLSYGVGGALGGFGSGFLWELWSPTALWWTASAVAAVGWWVAWRWLHPGSHIEE